MCQQCLTTEYVRFSLCILISFSYGLSVCQTCSLFYERFNIWGRRMDSWARLGWPCWYLHVYSLNDERVERFYRLLDSDMAGLAAWYNVFKTLKTFSKRFVRSYFLLPTILLTVCFVNIIALLTSEFVSYFARFVDLLMYFTAQ